MSARIKCLYCGKESNYIEFQMDDELREIIQLLPKFGGYQRLVMEYVELFGVTPLRIKTKKVLRLLGQVASFMDKEQFDFDRKAYRISKRGIAEALNITCNRHFDRPLGDHNYLKKVMISISDREQRERSVESEKRLRKKEERIMSGGREGVSLKEFKDKQGIESMAEGIGKQL